MVINHQKCFLNNLPPEKHIYRSRSNRTRQGTTDWSKIGKGVCKCSIVSLCSFNLYAEFNSVQFSSVSQSCRTLCDPKNRSTPGLPVHHQLPEFTQTHVHRGRDAIQPSHPLLSPSPPAPNPSQHQSLFQRVNSWKSTLA